MTAKEYSDLFTALEKLQETLIGISGAGGGIHFIDAQYYAAAVIKAIELLKRAGCFLEEGLHYFPCGKKHMDDEVYEEDDDEH